MLNGLFSLINQRKEKHGEWLTADSPFDSVITQNCFSHFPPERLVDGDCERLAKSATRAARHTDKRIHTSFE